MLVALTTGARIGPYEVITSIGAGGMGEVYRARDTRLNRDVALKILPDAFAADADRVARFTREAQALAALNHPNIAQIHGLEERALVMELVAGQDLSQLIARGPLPVSEAIPIAHQIADALEAAHESGIVHRDLKPANVKVRDDGTVKVLDFGLAKAMDPNVGRGFSPGGLAGPEGPAYENAMNSPTRLSPARTEIGVILGTAAYMSPEQAKGRVVDKRSDIWAFGVVLYEMLAGQPLFGGDSVAETIGLVVTREPDWTKLPAETPARVRRLLARCLTRDPKQRLRDIGEARVALADDGAPEATSLPAPARKRIWAYAVVVTVGILVGGAATWMLRSSAAPIEPPTAQVTIQLIERGMQLPRPQPSLAVSPDGTRLVYSSGAAEASIPGLWVRPLDSRVSTFLAGSSGRNAFFSPDGKWIASLNFGVVTKIPADAGAPVEVAKVPNAWGGTWTTRNEIVVAAGDRGLFVVPAAGGGTPRKVADGHLWYPDALPDGRHVLVTADNPLAQTSDDYRIAIVDLDTGIVKPLFDGGTYVRYAASGHLIYVRARSLMAVAFDPSALEVRGSPVAVVSNVHNNPSQPSAVFAVSPTGTLAYAPGTRNTDFDRTIVAVAPDGTRRTLGTEPRMFSFAPRISRDGTRLLVTTSAVRGRAWALNLQNGQLNGLTPVEYDIERAIWTPDGTQITVGASQGSEPPNIFMMSGAARGGPGSGRGPSDLQRLTTSANAQTPASWTPDGKTLVFVETASATGTDLWTVSLDGDRTPRPLLQTRSNEQAAAISPDGKRIAFESHADGQRGVYVADFPSMANQQRVSAANARSPVWSDDGRSLFFHQGGDGGGGGGRGRGVTGGGRGRGRTGGGGGDSVMAIDVGSPPRVTLSLPRRIVDVPGSTGFYGFDVLSDGSFVMVDAPQIAGAVGELGVILNWFLELRKKVPGR